MIIVNRDPAGVLGREIYELRLGLSIQENIESIFPNGLDAETTTLILNGDKVDPLVHDLSRQVTEFDQIHIISRPQGIELGVGAIAAIVAAVAAVAVVLLMPKPTIPNSSGEQKDSPNNRLTGQSNIARLYQAIPDIFGKVRVYPDLIALSLYEYINNVKTVTENLCIGVGQYLLENIKYADTPIGNITGSSYEIFNPGDVIPIFYDAFDSPDVDGQEITPPNLGNQVLYEASVTSLQSALMAGGSSAFVFKKTSQFDYFYNKTKPINVNFEVDIRFKRADSNGQLVDVTERAKYGGVMQGMSITDDGALINPQYYYNISISNVNFISMTAGPGFGQIYPPADAIVLTSYLKISDMEALYIGPFTLPVAADQIWYNVIFPRALRGTGAFTAEWWKINNAGDEIPGTRQTESFSYSGDTYESKYFTRKISPAAGFGRYAFRIKRTNNGSSELTDQAKLEEIFAIRVRYNVVAKDTLIRIVTTATEQATGFKDKKFNVEATRKTISYNGSDIDNTVRPSRDFADAVLHTFVVIAGRSPAELDIEELYRISASIKANNESLGWFDFSFDDKDISLGQRLQTICNAARVTVFRDGLKWRFVREEKKLFPVVQFDARNLANNTDGGTKQWKPSLPSSFDGVEVEYVDATSANDDGTDKKAYIRLRIDKQNKAIVEGFSSRPNKIQLAGCRNYHQAMNRAQLEIRRLIYQRVSVEDVALSDANIVQMGDRVRWADVYSEAIASGEITGISGNVFTTSETLEFTPNAAYKVSITDRYGQPSGWLNASPVTGNMKAFSAEYSDAYLADNSDVQSGSRFILTPSVSTEPMDFSLTNKSPGSDISTTNISLIQYDDRLFEYDEIA